MTFCFLGTIYLKNYQYYWSNIVQLLAIFGFILLFCLFDFHKGNELKENYILLEFAVLVFSYIILTIFVGFTSMLGLKEFFNLYKIFYKKYFSVSTYICSPYPIFAWIVKISSCCEKRNNEKNNINPNTQIKEINKISGKNEIEDESSSNIYLKENFDTFNKYKEVDENFEILGFFFFSILSSLAIIGFNKAIFSSFKKISTKNIFFPIMFLYACSFLSSLFFYFFYSLPKININCKKK